MAVWSRGVTLGAPNRVEWKPPVLNFWSDTDYAEDKEKLVDDSGHEGEEEKELSDMAKRMLEMLCSQCSFLVEERVKKVRVHETFIFCRIVMQAEPLTQCNRCCICLVYVDTH